MINGVQLGDIAGDSVSSAGDLNGDGFDDLIIGAKYAGTAGDNAGRSYVVFGQDTFSASFELSSLDGDNGFALNGIDTVDFSGNSVSSAGDVNNDGIDDIIIGASKADPNGNNSGETYVVFGFFNTDPIIVNPISDQAAGFSFPYSFTFDINTFFDADGDPLTYSAIVDGGDPLSTIGLSFDSNTRTFTGTPNTAGIFEITVTADDGRGGTVDDVFQLTIAPPILGTNGDDILRGTPNDDFMDGLPGNDRFISSPGNDRINGNDGIDLILYNNSPVGVDIDLSAGTASGGNAEGDFLENIEQIRGSNFADRLVGDAEFNTFFGRNGNDTLEAGIVGGALFGQNNDDLLIGSDIQDTLNGGNGNDTLHGGDDDDLLVGGRDNDLINGDGGNDNINSGSGDDLINGGGGNDNINTSSGLDTIAGTSFLTLGVGEIDTIRGGADADVIRLGTNSAAFYDDGLAGNGIADYALIRGHQIGIDTIELYSGETYFLGTSPIGGINGSGIYIDSDASGTLEQSVDEFIALTQGRILGSGQITGATPGFTFI